MTFNEEYEEAIQPIVDKIEVLSKTQTQIRYEEILNEATEELEKNRAEYEEQKADALAKLQEAADEIAVGEQKLADGKAELASKKQEFLDTIASAESQIAEGEAQLKQGEDEISRAYNEFLSTKEAASAQISGAEATIASKESELQQLETVVNQLMPVYYALTQLFRYLRLLIPLGKLVQVMLIAFAKHFFPLQINQDYLKPPLID